MVAPRLGTLSPWASKATDIAHNCGVDVRRVERVTEYHLATDEPLTEDEWGAAADLLHDRMTEAALPTRADAAALFDEREAEPMERVDVLGRGRVAIEEADTAYGLALSDDEVVLADEVLTPDSSRFWPADQCEPGHPQPSFDKQYVRDWLTSSASGWSKASGETPPSLPDDVVGQTRAKYVEAYERLTGETF